MKNHGGIALSVLVLCFIFSAQAALANTISQLDLQNNGCRYVWDKTINMPNPNKVTVMFRAKGNNDIHVCFSKEKDQTSPMYEVVIGGWDNTRSVIRRASQSQEIASVTRNGNDFSKVITPGRFEDYWVTMDHGMVQAGKGNMPGQNVIMSADDRNKFHRNLKYIAFSSLNSMIHYRDIRVSGVSDSRGPRYRPDKRHKRRGMHKAMVQAELVGEYLFDKVSLADSSGMNNDAKLLGSKNVPAKRQSAFCTSYSQGDYLEIPLNEKNTFSTNSFSASLWIKTTDNPSNPRGVMLNYLTYTVPQWSFSLTPGGNIAFVLRNDAKKTTAVSRVINDGRWHHVVGVRDRGKKEIRMYVDGQLAGTAQDVEGNVNSGQSIWVGNHLNRGFQGCVDDIRLYQNVLSDQMIRDLFNK